MAASARGRAGTAAAMNTVPGTNIRTGRRVSSPNNDRYVPVCIRRRLCPRDSKIEKSREPTPMMGDFSPKSDLDAALALISRLRADREEQRARAENSEAHMVDQEKELNLALQRAGAAEVAANSGSVFITDNEL